ncbi:TolB family protein [Solwaraspora sp. WMMB762]|uniref:TolB family protein n=1 Tax=Solwaraspora sp. WMMB762 TaxID=3404120 RepID=UPI003B92B764
MLLPAVVVAVAIVVVTRAGDGDGFMSVETPSAGDEVAFMRLALENGDPDGRPYDGLAGAPTISDDGRFIAYQTQSGALVPTDPRSAWGIVLRDRLSGAYRPVLLPNAIDGAMVNPELVADGSSVVFNVTQSLPYKMNTKTAQVELFLAKGLAENVVIAAGGEVRGSLVPPVVDKDASVFVLNVYADDQDMVLLGDEVTGQISAIMPPSLVEPGSDVSIRFPSVSRDGRYITFVSHETNSDTSGLIGERLWWWDRQKNVYGMIPVDGGVGDGYFGSSSISDDGRYVAFSTSRHLDSVDVNDFVDIYIYDRKNKRIKLVSSAVGGGQSDGDSGGAVVSADGRLVAFTSRASNLISGDSNAKIDVFVRDTVAGVTLRLSDGMCQGVDVVRPCDDRIDMTADGRFIAFMSEQAGREVSGTHLPQGIYVAELGYLPQGESIPPVVRVSTGMAATQDLKSLNGAWRVVDGFGDASGAILDIKIIGDRLVARERVEATDTALVFEGRRVPGSLPPRWFQSREPVREGEPYESASFQTVAQVDEATIEYCSAICFTLVRVGE